MAGVKRAARIWEVLAVIGFVLVFVLLSRPNINRIPVRGIEAEVKQNLHTIQLAVERYAVDHESVYPAFLVGGEARWSAAVNLDSSANAFTGQTDCPDLKQVADPLPAMQHTTFDPEVSGDLRHRLLAFFHPRYSTKLELAAVLPAFDQFTPRFLYCALTEVSTKPGEVHRYSWWLGALVV